MRILGNAHAERFFWAPTPLEVAPGRAVWERQRGREYLVFVDESFFEFFGFNNPNGNFCHAAIGFPADNYGALQERLAPIVQAYGVQVRKRLGRAEREVKSSDLRRLPIRFQARFARELADALGEQGGFVAGFYTPTDGFIMEDVRVSLIGAAEEVPQEHRDLYEVAREEALAQMRGPGQSGLITKLLFLPFAAFKFMLSSFGCDFRVQYDPRQGDEDRAVRDAIGDAMNLLLNVPAQMRPANKYFGMDANRRSEEELGLQLADVVAGYVRSFFRNNPAALREGSSARLITATSDEPLQKFEWHDGVLFKEASLHPMSAGLRRVLARRNIANMISYFYPVLAAGMLTCNTSNGQERDLEVSTGLILDLLD
jgi:hypothetical protein